MDIFADKSILVPVDLSDASDRAVDYALDMAATPQQVTVLHVALPYVAIEPTYMYLVDEELRRRKLEEEVRARFDAEKYANVRVEIRFGDPGDTIALYAKEHGVNLIVMPSHGRTGLAHLLIGSVAERVVRYATCPVLVLRGQ